MGWGVVGVGWSVVGWGRVEWDWSSSRVWIGLGRSGWRGGMEVEVGLGVLGGEVG